MGDDYIEDEGALAFIQKRKEYEGKDDVDPDAKKTFNYPSFMDRYFKTYYKLDVKKPFNDHVLYLHSNKVCVCTLAPSHPILDKTKYSVEKIEFIQNVSENMKGKHKQNAKLLRVMQCFCIIHCKNIQNDPPSDEKFGVYSQINAKLIETNEEIVKNPKLFQEKSQTDGYLAILYPKLDKLMEQFAALLNHDDYVKAVQDRSLKPTDAVAVQGEQQTENLIEDNKIVN